MMTEHRNIVQLVKGQDFFQIMPYDTVLFSSTIAFDAATFEVWGALVNGATLEIISQETLLDTKLLGLLLKEHKVTVASLIASVFNQHICHANIFKGLRCLIVGGEKVTSTCIYEVLDCEDGAPDNLLQAYGPTENTVFTTHYLISSDKRFSNIPIGQALNNTRLYVLDAHLNPLPIGAIGELYVSGAGVARG
ncbi:AMP-binding protein, partial [Legionella oakridgensis]|uniref:AMP-binding protein n=1 Tax=Legionella oakridgensis TaxID=29423 RepID=UPI0023786544